MGITRIESDPIIPHKHDVLGLCLLRPNMNFRALACASILGGVAEQIENHLPEQRRVGLDLRKGFHCPIDMPALRLMAEVANDRLNQLPKRKADFLELCPSRA